MPHWFQGKKDWQAVVLSVNDFDLLRGDCFVTDYVGGVCGVWKNIKVFKRVLFSIEVVFFLNKIK